MHLYFVLLLKAVSPMDCLDEVVKIEVDVDFNELLKQFNADEIADHFTHHRKIDDLIKEIGTDAIVSYLCRKESAALILDAMLEVSEVQAHIRDVNRWLELKKAE